MNIEKAIAWDKIESNWTVENKRPYFGLKEHAGVNSKYFWRSEKIFNFKIRQQTKLRIIQGLNMRFKDNN